MFLAQGNLTTTVASHSQINTAGEGKRCLVRQNNKTITSRALFWSSLTRIRSPINGISSFKSSSFNLRNVLPQILLAAKAAIISSWIPSSAKYLPNSEMFIRSTVSKDSIKKLVSSNAYARCKRPAAKQPTAAAKNVTSTWYAWINAHLHVIAKTRTRCAQSKEASPVNSNDSCSAMLALDQTSRMVLTMEGSFQKSWSLNCGQETYVRSYVWWGQGMMSETTQIKDCIAKQNWWVQWSL